MSTRSFWVPRRFKGKDVWVRSSEAGEPIVSNGRLDVRYNAKPGVKIYSGSPQNLEPAEGSPTAIEIDEAEAVLASAPSTAKEAARPKRGGAKALIVASGPEPIAGVDARYVIYTDGACSGNPGPAGSGVVILDATRRIELSIWLGTATNNIAELTAIDAALRWLALDRGSVAERIILHSDSDYSIKVLLGQYKAKKNVELIRSIQERLRPFERLEMRWVRGHVGVVENERADELAREAIARSKSGAYLDGSPSPLPIVLR
ncbi:MAG: ribonuclease HI [Myxococcales bacterium]|nr:ribonuclease HI [Myxococcales bacterium]